MNFSATETTSLVCLIVKFGKSLARVTEQTHDIRVYTNLVGLFCDAG